MTQTEARPYLQVSVQIDTPDGPAIDGKPVHTVSWTATRHDSGRVEYSVSAHHHGADDAPLCERLTRVLTCELINPAIVPDWVPWPPAGWLASLELRRDRFEDASAAIDAYEAYHAAEWRS